MSKHTKGLIYAGCEDDPKSGDIYADDGSLIAECFVNGKPKTREANARRLAACWNACNGISTKTLESCYGERGGIDAALDEASLNDHLSAINQRDDLLVALQVLTRDCKMVDSGIELEPAIRQALTAIAKVTGVES